MKNIHVLPTDKPSRLHLQNGNLVLHRLQYTLVSQHIYITNDEEIKEGDWYLTKDEKLIKELFSIGRKGKIILTTDQDLIKDGVQAIDDEFLEWFVKNPSCEFVNAYFYKGIETGHYYRIDIPKEEPKQETLEEVAREYLFEVYQKQFIVKTNDIQHGVLKGFIAGAKWQQQQNKNLYSEEEMIDIFFLGMDTLDKALITKDEALIIIKQFKKK